ncbi:MAG: transporter [Solirubrobacterales bacterium]
MGVLLTIVAIAVSASAGVAAEQRWPATAVSWARRLLVISLYTLIPVVVFFNLDRAHLNADLAGGLVTGWVAILSAVGLAWVAGSRLLRLARPSTGTLISTTAVPNSGYLGYPLTASLLGFHALGQAVVYDVIVVSPCLLLIAFGAGASFGTRAGESPRERAIAFFTRNPPLYAAIAAVIAPASFAPDVLVDISRGMVIALLPIGFFAVGAVLAEEAEEGTLELGSPFSPPIRAAILLRLAIAPGLLLLLSLPFIDLPGPYLLLAAMPCGVNSLLVSHVYGLDAKLAAQAVAWTTSIAVFAALIAQAIWG